MSTTRYPECRRETSEEVKTTEAGNQIFKKLKETFDKEILTLQKTFDNEILTSNKETIDNMLRLDPKLFKNLEFPVLTGHVLYKKLTFEAGQSWLEEKCFTSL